MNYDNRTQGQGALYESVMNNSSARTQNATNYAGAQTDYAGTQTDYMTGVTATISRRAYNGIIGLIVLWGVGLDTFICYYFRDALTATFQNSWAMILLYLALTIGGIVIVNKAESPLVSFLGYNLLVVGFGITLTMVVEFYAPAVVLEAFLVTAIVTALMLLMGTLWAEFFKSLGRVLVIGLIGVIIVEAGLLLFTGTYPTWISVISAILFSGFIGYDWAKAQESTPTAKNAVLFATSLYVDIVNLFLDILRILGKSR